MEIKQEEQQNLAEEKNLIPRDVLFRVTSFQQKTVRHAKEESMGPYMGRSSQQKLYLGKHRHRAYQRKT